MLGAPPGRRIALLGRMAELGEFEEAEHREAGAVAAVPCDMLVCVGRTCRALVGGGSRNWPRRSPLVRDKEEAAAAVAAIIEPGDYVLVKASRGEAFETILHVLEDAR